METMDQDRRRNEHRSDEQSRYPHEGKLTGRIERRTARTPSIIFLAGSVASIIGSITLYATGRRLAAIFVGHWAPMFMMVGLYNKLVKEEYEFSRGGRRSVSEAH